MKRVAIFRASLLQLSETFIRDQARALHEWHPVMVGFRAVEGGLQIPDIPREIVPVSASLIDTVRFWLARPIPGLVQRLRQLPVELVHAHFGLDATDIWPSVKAAGLPMVVTLHGYDIAIHSGWWKAGHGGVRRRVYPFRLLQMAKDPAVSFVAVSHAIKRRAVEYGIPEEKITVAYIGVDVRRFTLGGLPRCQRSKRILFVGRMVEKKAPLLMIRTFAEVRRKIPDAELVMVGGGPLLGDAERLAGELAVPVTFLGARSLDEVIAQLHQARVFCLPSVTVANGDTEGFPMVILEAQACGVPVVSSAYGGAEEGLIHGVTGYKAREGCLEDLLAGILAFLDDAKSQEDVALNARHHVEMEFDNRLLAQDMERIYTAVANQRQGQR